MEMSEGEMLIVSLNWPPVKKKQFGSNKTSLTPLHFLRLSQVRNMLVIGLSLSFYILLVSWYNQVIGYCLFPLIYSLF